MLLLRLGLFALLVAPALAVAQTLPAVGSDVSLQSVNNPSMYVQHANGLGAISGNTAAGQPDATFKMVAGLTGEAGTVSFQSVQDPAQYLRHQGFRVKMQTMGGGPLFNRDATFKPVGGLSGQGTSFESVNFPGHYIRHCSFELYLDNNQRRNARCNASDAVYRQDASYTVVTATPPAAGGGERITIDGTAVLTGAIQVTLEWDTSVADLDLFVTDPSGARVGYDNQSVASGGILDVDARAGCAETASTVENIVWQGTPPRGTYQVTVDHFQQCSGAGPVSYTATLRRGGQVVETWRGSVDADQEQVYTFASE